ncbi:MAG: M48 family metallopeptidase [Phycisphaerales bacterium]|jgi:Zn-dependent protease with chaperone function|nr:M48 family metallopeptidase [Phycisphaerales bacterium]
MNFYEHQDRAHRRTKIIVFLFILAVLCIIAIIGIPVGIATQWSPEAVGASAVFCLLIVGIATLVKLSQLRGGGESVAEMLGGTVLHRDGLSGSERKVQNIVEEMAIASGMPVPSVYVIEDDEINAFAAGWTSDDAVVGVTRGCIEKLNRDELQGVIAHEFSHISHGDMRINIRLIGVVFGIMALGITGWVLVRYVGPAVLRSSSRSRSKEGAGGAGVGLAIIVFGLFLALCGAIGTFFGRLIQAAVSRQREFLADASAVQYTRNPDGIGGALRKIGGMKQLKNISSEVGQCNHMFFSQAMNAMFASHPPITDRIARVESVDVASLGEQKSVSSSKAQTSRGSGVSHFSSSSVRKSVRNASGIDDVCLLQAKFSIESIDPDIKKYLSSGWSARLVMFALVANDNKDSQQMVAKILSVSELVEYRKISSLVLTADATARLPMIDFAAPALRTLSPEQIKTFNKNIVSIVSCDGVVDRFEWVLVSVLQKHMSDVFGGRKITLSKKPLSSYPTPVSIILGTLAYCGSTNQREATIAFQAGANSVGMNIQIPDVPDCNMSSVNGALKELRLLRFSDKELLIEACGNCVTHDDKVTVVEAETLRAIGDVLDCPIPMYT